MKKIFCMLMMPILLSISGEAVAKTENLASASVWDGTETIWCYTPTPYDNLVTRPDYEAEADEELATPATKSETEYCSAPETNLQNLPVDEGEEQEGRSLRCLYWLALIVLNLALIARATI